MSGLAKIIRVIDLPHGDAPERVREQWIGCVLPCAGFRCGHVLDYVESVIKPSPPEGGRGLTAREFFARAPQLKIDGFNVWQDIALQVLYEYSPEAFNWFVRQGFPKPDKCFRFKLEEIKVLKMYTHEELSELRYLPA